MHPRFALFGRLPFHAAALLLLVYQLPSEAATERECYWVFLNKGEGRGKLAGMDKDQVTRMQQEHVGNLGALYKQGRAFTAGPLGDNGFIRGTVVLNLTNLAEVKDCFKPDPFVQNDVLAVQAYRWLVDTTKFHQPEEPFKLAKHTLLVVKKGEHLAASHRPTDANSWSALLPSLGRMPAGREPAVGGPLVNGGEVLGVVLFFSDDAAGIESWLTSDPAVKSGRVRLEVHPQLLGAGVLRSVKRNGPV